MADLLASNVTIIASWTNGTPTGKRNIVRQVKWTGTTAGGATNRLLASALGFNKILACGNVLLDSATKKVYRAAPSADGTLIFTGAVASDNVADVATSTDFAYCTIEGV